MITSALTLNEQASAAFTYPLTSTASPASGDTLGYNIVAGSGASVLGSSGTHVVDLGTGTDYWSGASFSLETGAAGTFTFSLKVFQIAPDGLTQTLIDSGTLTVTAWFPPVITSPASATGLQASAFSYTITATTESGHPPVNFSASGLPPGLSCNSATGIISGTPTTAGVYNVTTACSNPWGGEGSVTITIESTAPVITSASTASGTQGAAFSYSITATNSPASFAATGLPSGLSINTGTGLISGTPTAAATSTVTLSATNAHGTGSETLTLTVAGAHPAITSGPLALGTVGTALSYQITASYSPTSFAATGLPAGMSVNTSTGLISGTPTGAGTSTVTVGATNSHGTGTAAVTFTIYAEPPGIPVIVSGPYAYLGGDNPAQGILLGGGPGTLDPGADVPVVNDSTIPPVILRGPYAEVGSAAKPGIVLGAVAPPAPAPAGAGSGLGGGILAGDGWYYVTPYLRYSGGSPPQEQTLIGESWVTDRSIS